MKTLTVPQRIKKAQRDNEREMIAFIRKHYNSHGEGYKPFMASVANRNALDRLVKQGRVRYSEYREYHNAPYSRDDYKRNGYWVVEA